MRCCCFTGSFCCGGQGKSLPLETLLLVFHMIYDNGFARHTVLLAIKHGCSLQKWFQNATKWPQPGALPLLECNRKWRKLLRVLLTRVECEADRRFGRLPQ